MFSFKNLPVCRFPLKNQSRLNISFEAFLLFFCLWTLTPNLFSGSQNFHTLAESLSRQEALSHANQEGGESAPNAPTHPRNRWRCMQPRVCNYCWKTFSNSFNLKQHIVNVHIQSQGVSCNVCDKVVKNKWYLRKHLVTAHGAPLKRSKGSNGTNAADDKVSNPETNDNMEKINHEINQEILDVVSN